MPTNEAENTDERCRSTWSRRRRSPLTRKTRAFPSSLAVTTRVRFMTGIYVLPLRNPFEAQRPGEFGWEYLEQGPVVWRVALSKS